MASLLPSIKIDSGIKRIAINDDPDNVIEFNPTDVIFAEKFYALMRDFEAKQDEFDRRSKELDAHKDELDANGLPVNFAQGVAFLRETCGFMREKIDYLFGDGASQKAFGDTLSLDMIAQFFQGMTPFIQTARADKVLKYTNSKMAGRVMK
jgi:hypothetical protein